MHSLMIYLYEPQEDMHISEICTRYKVVDSRCFAQRAASARYARVQGRIYLKKRESSGQRSINWSFFCGNRYLDRIEIGAFFEDSQKDQDRDLSRRS